MLYISKVNNSVKVEGLDNRLFPDNGTLTAPLNSVILVLDESEIVTFRSAANNNVFFSANISQIRISGSAVTKQTIISAWDAVANASSGGGGSVDAYTKAETDALIANEATLRAQADADLQNQVNTVNSNAVKATVTGTTLNLTTLA